MANLLQAFVCEEVSLLLGGVMRGHARSFRWGFAALLTLQTTAVSTAFAAQHVNPTAAVLLEYRERIDKYMELRDDAIDDVDDAEETRNPALIRQRERALAERIRAARAGAKHGDIFTPEVRALFRRLLAPELEGEPGQDIRSTLTEDAPAPGAIPIEVNGKYPAGQPFVTTPAPVLAALPPLPGGLEYRFVGKDLILLDQPADVVLDYMRNAIK